MLLNIPRVWILSKQVWTCEISAKLQALSMKSSRKVQKLEKRPDRYQKVCLSSPSISQKEGEGQWSHTLIEYTPLYSIRDVYQLIIEMGGSTRKLIYESLWDHLYECHSNKRTSCTQKMTPRAELFQLFLVSWIRALKYYWEFRAAKIATFSSQCCQICSVKLTIIILYS